MQVFAWKNFFVTAGLQLMQDLWPIQTSSSLKQSDLGVSAPLWIDPSAWASLFSLHFSPVPLAKLTYTLTVPHTDPRTHTDTHSSAPANSPPAASCASFLSFFQWHARRPLGFYFNNCFESSYFAECSRVSRVSLQGFSCSSVPCLWQTE